MKHSQFMRAQVAVLYRMGHSAADIMHQLHCTRKFVDRWRNETGKNASFADRPRSGRPHKLSVPIIRKVRRMTTNKRGKCTRSIARKLKEKGEADVSHVTVWRELRECGLKAYLRRRKPKMTQAHAKIRLKLVRGWKKMAWHTVVFSDEKIFRMFRPPHKKKDIVWAMSPDDVPPVHVEKYSASFHVWGAICSLGKTKLVVIEDTLDSLEYQNILQEALLPRMKTLFKKQPFKFQQDHATPHNSKSTQKWLRANVPDFFDKESWPAKSPDLNPIEHVWGLMEGRINRDKLHSVDGFKKAVMKAWDSIKLPEIVKLIDSMPRRCDAVREAKGWHSKY
jgi:transposase